MKTRYRKFTMFFACSLYCFSIFGQPIPLDTALRTGKLKNGFTYYIRRNTSPASRVQLYLVNKVGSVLEDEDQQGLAHFMEHMNFNGTTHFPKNQLVDYLQKSGVRFGADLNAYTSFDETVYQLPVPTDDPVVLQNGFQILRDWAADATLDSIEIDKERGVVLEEERLGKGAGERMQRQIWPVLLNQSRYAERIPIGKEEILNNFPHEAIRRFHTDWYRPDLQALVVVGDIDVDKTERLVKLMFSDLKNPANERPRTKYSVPLNGENHFLSVTDREQTATALQILIKHAPTELVTQADYIGAMKRQLFNEILSERFAMLAQQPGLPFVEASSDISELPGGLSVFEFGVVAKDGQLEAGFEKSWTEVERLRRFGFTESELSRAKQNYLTGMEAAFREKDKTQSENFVGEYQRLFLTREASPGIFWEYHFVLDHISQISLTDMNELAREFTGNINRDIFIMAPEKDKKDLPDSVTVAAWMKKVSDKNLTVWKEEKNNDILLAQKPAAGKVVERKQEAAGITELTLSNGARVILKPTGFKNDEIRFAAFAPGGSSVYPDRDFQSASNAVLVGGFGVASFDPVTLDRMMAGKRIKSEPFIGERWQGMQGFSSPQDLETALQLLYLQFTRPRQDTVLFKNILDNSRDMLRNRNNDPSRVFRDTVNYVLGNYSLRRTPPTVEKLNEIDIPLAYKIYRERFSDASGFTFVFVGSFNSERITPLLEEYIGGLPSTYRNETSRDLGIHIPRGKMVKKVYGGTENKATVKMVFSGDYDYSPAANMQLTAVKEILQIKITEHLREDESEVYSPSVQVSYDKYPRGHYFFTVAFGCAPKNADHLMDLVETEINTLKQRGPESVDVEKFKAEYFRSHEVQYGTNETWLDYITTQLQTKGDLGMVLCFKERLDKVTQASVRRTAEKYLDNGNEIRFELLPEFFK